MLRATAYSNGLSLGNNSRDVRGQGQVGGGGYDVAVTGGGGRYRATRAQIARKFRVAYIGCLYGHDICAVGGPQSRKLGGDGRQAGGRVGLERRDDRRQFCRQRCVTRFLLQLLGQRFALFYIFGERREGL